MGKGSTPQPPDPRETSAAQTGTNIGTAIANNAMGMIDQVTPYGSLTYETVGGPQAGQPYNPASAAPPAPAMATGGQTYQGDNPLARRVAAAQGASGGQGATSVGGAVGAAASGGFTYRDPYTGKTYNIPRYKATTSLSPEQQAILDQSQAAQQNLAATANERSGFLRDYLPGTEALTDQIDSKLYDLGAQRLDPRFASQEDALRTRLANQGITAGSEAWRREMDQFGEGRNDAYNQLMLQGRGQALSEVNNPINQITALLSGSQVQNPAVSMYQPQGAATTDVAGLINQNYGQQVANYQQRQGSLGGLFGAGATLLGAPQGSILGGLMMSDRRLKRDIRLLRPGWLNLYEYRYVWDAPGTARRGYMAQEVLGKVPAAVHTVGGWLALDYGKLPEVPE